MKLPDVSILVHAHNRQSGCHNQARNWWDETLAGTEGVGLAWVTILGFVRITTNRRILLNPLAVGDVLERIHSWLLLPHVHIPTPSQRHFVLLSRLLEDLGTAGNLTTDAHLAALALERGYVLYSTDADFSRFPHLKWVNPCQ